MCNAKKQSSTQKRRHLYFYDTRVAAISNNTTKVSTNAEDLDGQIKSMITKSDVIAGGGKGYMATCNICGKEGLYKAMPRHIEAYHIAGVSHACDICGKVSRSRNALNMHKSREHI